MTKVLLESGYYLIFTITTNRIGHGYRRVYASVGRKKVRVLDWASGAAETMAIPHWLATIPSPIEPPRRRYIKAAIARTGKTKLMKEAYAATRR